MSKFSEFVSVVIQQARSQGLLNELVSSNGTGVINEVSPTTSEMTLDLSSSTVHRITLGGSSQSSTNITFENVPSTVHEVTLLFNNGSGSSRSATLEATLIAPTMVDSNTDTVQLRLPTSLADEAGQLCVLSTYNGGESWVVTKSLISSSSHY